jgi:hypothetical protein
MRDPPHSNRMERTMADDKRKPGGQDRTRINANEDSELRD